ARATLPFDDGFPVVLTIDCRSEGAGFIDFEHETRDSRNPQQIQYRVYLNWSRPQFGGRRYWFSCPATGERAARLFLPSDGQRFMSRAAYRLAYACQREGPAERLMRKARKLHRALGGQGDELEAPDKPKGMHWRTYERKLAAAQRADEAFALSLAPILRRFGGL